MADTAVPSTIFDAGAWAPVDGFNLTDVTYHRALDTGVVRVAFDRPEVRNAFRPHTVDELMNRKDLEPRVKAKILGQNALRFYDLKAPAGR